MTAVINLVSSLAHSHFLMERTISDPQFTALQMSKADLSLRPGFLPTLLSSVTPSGPAACLLVDKWMLLECDLGALKGPWPKISSSVPVDWASHHNCTLRSEQRGFPLQIQDYKYASGLGLHVTNSPMINHPYREGALTHYLPKLFRSMRPRLRMFSEEAQT